MTAIEALIEQADGHAEDSTHWGNRNHGWHFALGILTIFVGVVAAGIGAVGVESAITGVVGLVAGGIGGVQSFASPEDRAQWHYAHVGEYEAVANKARVLADRRGPVDETEITALVDELKELRTRRFPAGPGQSDQGQ
jgi:hypothetical protein